MRGYLLHRDVAKSYGQIVFFMAFVVIYCGSETAISEQTFRDYPYFRHVLIESKAYTRIGGWWDRKGENEIDIVAENELNAEK